MEFGQLPDPTLLHRVDFSLPEAQAQIHGASRSCAIRIGAPVWSCPQWIGSLYPKGTAPRDFLHHYARHFTAIELNSTFYAIPSTDTIRRWDEQTPAEFRFVPKVPKTISHSLGFKSVLEDALAFYKAVAELGEKLGPCFLQLPPQFDRSDIKTLARFLTLNPRVEGVRLAIEFRHPDWFSPERQLIPEAVELLLRHGCSAVVTDTAGRRDAVHGSFPQSWLVVRFLGNSLHPSDFTRTADWMGRIEASARQGSLEEVFFFVHQPDNAKMPELALPLIRKTREQQLTSLGLRVVTPSVAPAAVQMALF